MEENKLLIIVYGFLKELLGAVRESGSHINGKRVVMFDADALERRLAVLIDSIYEIIIGG